MRVLRLFKERLDQFSKLFFVTTVPDAMGVTEDLQHMIPDVRAIKNQRHKNTLKLKQ